MIQNTKGFVIKRDNVHIPESASCSRSKIAHVLHECDQKYISPRFSVWYMLFRVKDTSLRNAVAGLVELQMSISSKQADLYIVLSSLHD